MLQIWASVTDLTRRSHLPQDQGGLAVEATVRILPLLHLVLATLPPTFHHDAIHAVHSGPRSSVDHATKTPPPMDLAVSEPTELTPYYSVIFYPCYGNQETHDVAEEELVACGCHLRMRSDALSKQYLGKILKTVLINIGSSLVC